MCGGFLRSGVRKRSSSPDLSSGFHGTFTVRNVFHLWGVGRSINRRPKRTRCSEKDRGGTGFAKAADSRERRGRSYKTYTGNRGRAHHGNAPGEFIGRRRGKPSQ